MVNYEGLKNKQAELIRKALDGSVFFADETAPTLLKLTDATGLAELPEGWDDLGFLSNDGAQHGRDVSSSDVTSWGAVGPTRSDITNDTTTLTFVGQETKRLTMSLVTGADPAGIVADANGEVQITKPTRPKGRHYQALSLAVDENAYGEIYVARYLPRAKATSYAEQNFGGGDDPISWGATMTGYVHTGLGFSERWLFGGPGWTALLGQMDIPIDAPAWEATTTYVEGDTVSLTGGEVLQATVGGTSGSTEPTAPAVIGSTVTDGSVTWRRIA